MTNGSVTACSTRCIHPESIAAARSQLPDAVDLEGLERFFKAMGESDPPAHPPCPEGV